tara:strand:+ start:2348 stop:2887 length:540 start_codon:yes stop_codon:yes gene_type:complete
MLNSKNTSLIIVDVQGNLARSMHNATELLNNLSILIRGSRLLDVPIIWMEQIPEKLGNTVEELTIHLDGMMPIKKNVFSCAKNEKFNSRLNEINPVNVVICGIETHICVYQTALDLLGKNFNVEVVADATAARLNYNKEIGLKKITQAGGAITTVETFLFEVQSIAKGKKFRDLIKLVK